MNGLNLNFIDDGNRRKPDLIEQVLYRFGDEICRYAQGYFNYIVTTTLEYDMVREAAIYIIVPEIDYNHRILSISYIDVENVVVEFFALKTQQVEATQVSVKEGSTLLENRLAELLSTNVSNTTFRYLIDLVIMKRERNEE